jgi:RNA polymerase subunit RPABC4/transcription elongation factor Spt4
VLFVVVTSLLQGGEESTCAVCGSDQLVIVNSLLQGEEESTCAGCGSDYPAPGWGGVYLCWVW